jgi:hypothetical protein
VILAVLALAASVYLGTAQSGRSRPIRCLCEDDDGQQHEVFVKGRGFFDGLEYDDLTCELVANQFACDLGLPAAKPCVVAVSKEFLTLLHQEVDGPRISAAFDDSSGRAFGSLAFKEQVRRWDHSNIVRKGQLEEAVNLYLFDTIVENTDRGIGNPNLLASGDIFKVIDFGHCFQRCAQVDGANYGRLPWHKGGIKNHVQGGLQHVLFSGLTGVTSEKIDHFVAKIENLSDNVIESYVSIVPEEWGQDTACRIVDYLLDARQNASEFAARAKEVLIR